MIGFKLRLCYLREQKHKRGCYVGYAINFVSSRIGRSIITEFCVVCLEPYIQLLLGLSYNSVMALLFYFKFHYSVNK